MRVLNPASTSGEVFSGVDLDVVDPGQQDGGVGHDVSARLDDQLSSRALLLSLLVTSSATASTSMWFSSGR